MAKRQPQKKTPKKPTTNGRTSSGKFAKGNKLGNGRPKLNKALREWCQEKTLELAEIVYGIASDVTMRPGDRIKAAALLLAYGNGAPPQTVEHKSDDKAQAIVVNLSQ